MKIYEKQLESCIIPETQQYNTKQNYVIDLIHQYAGLTSKNEKNKREYLRQLELKISDKPINKVDEIYLDNEEIDQINYKLNSTREAKFIKKQKSINEPAFEEVWTDIETLNLLNGIKKHGEHAWTDICDKYNFQSFRTPNSLAFKWNQLKFEMMEEIQEIHKSKNIIISKWDWIQCFIHKLEVKCGHFVPHQPLSEFPPSWPQQKYLKPPTVKHFNIQNTGMDLSSKLEITGKDKKGIIETNVIQQLCNNFEDCLNKFKPSIEGGEFIIEDVKKYIYEKQTEPVYPRYFELHHVPQKEDGVGVAEGPCLFQRLEGRLRVLSTQIEKRLEA